MFKPYRYLDEVERLLPLTFLFPQGELEGANTSYYSKLVHEYQDDEQGTDIFHEEEIDVEKTSTESAPVCELVAHNLVWQIPTNEKAGEETTDGEEHLTRDEIEDVEQRLSEERQSLHTTKRQRAERTHDTTADSDYERSTVAGETHLLLEKGCADLMERDERRECGERQQGIEHQTYNISHYGQRRECLLEHVGKSDEDERRTGIGADTNAECRRENH